MSDGSNVRPVIVGGVLAAMAIGAFAIGWTMSLEPEDTSAHVGD